MRIIAGEFRGRKILPPAGDTTRPITDRVKQSLFDILTPYLPGAVVYDCFAGTGSLGLESLSRGAESAVFFEQDRSAGSMLRKNIAALGVGGKSKVIAGDLFQFFLGNTELPKTSLVFLDPPYRMLKEQSADLRKLAQSLAAEFMQQDALLIFRHRTDDELELPPLVRFDLRDYGSMVIEILKS